MKIMEISTQLFSQMAPGTCNDLFIGYSTPESQFQGSATGTFTAVPLLYAALFQGFDVFNWSTFGANASRMLIGANNKHLTHELSNEILRI